MNEEYFTSKFYVSKKDDKEVCFKLDFKIEAYQQNKGYCCAKIYATICYQYLKMGDVILKSHMNEQDFWMLKYDGFRWNFHSSVMISSEYRSLGIGTFIINQMLAIALIYAPTAELGGMLSGVDEDNLENHTRRDKLYQNLGFKFDENNMGFSIDKISDLKIRKEFDYIKEVQIADVFCQFRILKAEKEVCEDRLKQDKNTLYELSSANDKLRKQKKILSFVLVGLAIVMFYLYYNKFLSL